jgi:hypothetical protein
VGALGWRDQNGEIHFFILRDYDSEDTRVVQDGPYSMSLVAVAVGSVSSRANFTSTLGVVVDDIGNGTNISCLVFGDGDHLLVYKTSAPLSPWL